MEGAFDPEGLISSLTCVVTTIFGLHCGHVLLAVPSAYGRFLHWVPLGLVQLLLGLLLHFMGLPLNPNLYSLSFLFLSGGTCFLVLAVLYWLVDFCKSLRRVWQPFMYLGMNAIAIYVLAESGPIQVIYCTITSSPTHAWLSNTILFTVDCIMVLLGKYRSVIKESPLAYWRVLGIWQLLSLLAVKHSNHSPSIIYVPSYS